MMKKFIAFQNHDRSLVIGALIGNFFPDFGMTLRPIGDGFIRWIKMIVVPIVFSTIVIGGSWKWRDEEKGQPWIKDNHLV